MSLDADHRDLGTAHIALSKGDRPSSP